MLISDQYFPSKWCSIRVFNTDVNIDGRCNIQLHVNFAKLPVTCSHLQFWKVNGSVTLCKDSVHADWILRIASIDANIEYTSVVENMQCDQKLQGKWQQLLSAEKIIWLVNYIMIHCNLVVRKEYLMLYAYTIDHCSKLQTKVLKQFFALINM